MHFSSFKNNKKHIHIIVARITESFVYFNMAIPIGSFCCKIFCKSWKQIQEEGKK